MPNASNDDQAVVRTTPADPYGEAALILVESLIHGLLARSVLPLHEALEIVQTAIDVQCEIGVDRGDEPAARGLSVRLLTAIADSLRIDAISGEDGDSGASESAEGETG